MRSRVGLLLIFGLAVVAHADEVVLKDGRRLAGRAKWTPAGLRVELKQGMAVMVFPREEVRELIQSELPEDALARTRAALAPDDDAGALALAVFAQDKGLEREARELLLTIAQRPEAKVKPSCRTAAIERLTAMDLHFVDGRWLPPEEFWPARGYVRSGTRWIPAAEAARERAAEEAAKAAESLARAERCHARKAADLERGEAALKEAKAEAPKLAKALEKAEKAAEAAWKELADAARGDGDAGDEKSGTFQSLRQHECAPCKCEGECSPECDWSSKRDELKTAWEDAKEAESESDQARLKARQRAFRLDRERAAARKAKSANARELAAAKDEVAACRMALGRAEKRLEQARERVAQVSGGGTDGAPSSAAPARSSGR